MIGRPDDGADGWPPTIRNGEDERLACSWVERDPDGDLTDGARAPWLVVIGHGLTSDRERPWSQALSGALAGAGVDSVRVAFSGNGDSDGHFVDSCITKEVGDLGAVLDAAAAAGRRCAYVGHSMGSAVGTLRAADDARIEVLVGLAGMAHTADFIERLFGDLPLGEPMLDKEHCPYGATLRDDLRQVGSLTGAAPRVKVPWLLVHGGADDVVPVADSRDLAAAAGADGRPPVELRELPGVDHSFTGDSGLAALVPAVVPWLLARLDEATGRDPTPGDPGA